MEEEKAAGADPYPVIDRKGGAGVCKKIYR